MSGQSSALEIGVVLLHLLNVGLPPENSSEVREVFRSGAPPSHVKPPPDSEFYSNRHLVRSDVSVLHCRRITGQEWGIVSAMCSRSIKYPQQRDLTLASQVHYLMQLQGYTM